MTFSCELHVHPIKRDMSLINSLHSIRKQHLHKVVIKQLKTATAHRLTCKRLHKRLYALNK